MLTEQEFLDFETGSQLESLFRSGKLRPPPTLPLIDLCRVLDLIEVDEAAIKRLPKKSLACGFEKHELANPELGGVSFLLAQRSSNIGDALKELGKVSIPTIAFIISGGAQYIQQFRFKKKDFRHEIELCDRTITIVDDKVQNLFVHRKSIVLICPTTLGCTSLVLRTSEYFRPLQVRPGRKHLEALINGCDLKRAHLKITHHPARGRLVSPNFALLSLAVHAAHEKPTIAPDLYLLRDHSSLEETQLPHHTLDIDVKD